MLIMFHELLWNRLKMKEEGASKEATSSQNRKISDPLFSACLFALNSGNLELEKIGYTLAMDTLPIILSFEAYDYFPSGLKQCLQLFLKINIFRTDGFQMSLEDRLWLAKHIVKKLNDFAM